MHLRSTEYCARSWGSMTKATAHQDSADCARTLLSQNPTEPGSCLHIFQTQATQRGVISEHLEIHMLYWPLIQTP